jgi:hypothetical protein
MGNYAPFHFLDATVHPIDVIFKLRQSADNSFDRRM